MYKIGQHYHLLINDIKQNVQRRDHGESSVKLIAVSKKQSIEKVKALYECGQREFGENQVQEALKKMNELSELDIIWHFIGAIQSNKTKAIAENFSWVQSICSERQAKRLNDQRSNRLVPLNVCIQLNLDEEKTKAGVGFDALFPLAECVSHLPKLTLRGVMAIPKKLSDKTDKDLFSKQRKQFADVRVAFDELKKRYPSVDTLSMGMSGDYQAAIAEGATMIRIGTVLFGLRDY